MQIHHSKRARPRSIRSEAEARGVQSIGPFDPVSIFSECGRRICPRRCHKIEWYTIAAQQPPPMLSQTECILLKLPASKWRAAWSANAVAIRVSRKGFRSDGFCKECQYPSSKGVLAISAYWLSNQCSPPVHYSCQQFRACRQQH